MASSSALQLADLALVWSNATGDADLAMIDDDLASDRGLVTAVLLSLFTDRRAENDDVPPSGDSSDRRGWWADQFAAVEGDRIGSRLWLLDRSTLTNETLLKAKGYVAEALQWMIDDKVVASIPVTVTRMTAPDGIMIAGELLRPGRDSVSFRFAHTWDHIEEDL
jgi:phage gp46-like protein